MITKITHMSLFVNDQDKALAFYTEKLGFNVHSDVMFGEMRWLTLHAIEQPDFELCLMLATTPEQKALVGKQAADLPIFCVATSDCRKSYEELKAKGVEFTVEPREVPWGTDAIFKDLYGNIINLVQETKQ